MVQEIGRRRLLMGGLVVGLAAAGCRQGTTTAVRGTTPAAAGTTSAAQDGDRRPGIAGPSEADARRALRAWAAFPVGATPRPVVLIEAPVVDPAAGFPDGASKLAYAAGAFDLPAAYPAGPGRAAGLPLVDARQAAALLRAQGNGPASPTRLPVTGIRLGSAEFRTDRGSRQLPAWLFSLRGVGQPAAVLAVAPSARFAPRLPAAGRAADTTRGSATLSPDGRTVTVGFVSSPAGSPACGADYILRVVETRQAVALRIGLTAPEEDGPASHCEDSSYHRAATAHLARPLGARVLILAQDAKAVEVALGA